MFHKLTKIALSSALALGLITAGLPAWAAPEEDNSAEPPQVSETTEDESAHDLDLFTLKIDDRPHYVAIGDSYSASGWGPTTFWEPCFRNAVDYPHLTSVATLLPLVQPACAGGSGTSYWYPSRLKGTNLTIKLPYRKLINKETTLVTVSLGLNDIMLAYNMRLLRKCLLSAFTNSDRLNRGACEEAVETEVRPLLEILPKVLEGIYKDAKQRANKDALVLAVGYVSFFYDDHFCWDNLTIGPADRAYISSIFDDINEAVRTGAHNADVPTYIPADNQFYLTSTCGVPGLRYSTAIGLPEVAYPLHPTPTANAIIASHIAKMYWEHHRQLENTPDEAPVTSDEAPTTPSTTTPPTPGNSYM